MEYKTLFIVCIFILAIFTLGAVSASEDVSSDSLAVNEIWEVQGQTVSSLDENDDLTYFDDEITGNWSDVNDDPVDDEITGNWSDVNDDPVDDEITGNWSDVNDDPVDVGDDENDDEDGIHASIWNDEDERGPIYTDSEGSIIDVDVPGGFEGSIIVMINGEEKGSWEIEHEDDDWAYHGWGLEDLDMAEAGFYHILVLYQNEDNPDGEIIANETVTVKEFGYDELRALILYAAESIKLFVPDGAQGTVTIITDIEVEDGEPEQINEISYEITSQDYGNWIDWSLEDLGFEADNRFRIFTLTVTNNDEEIYRYRISHVDGEVDDDDETPEFMEFYIECPDEEEIIFDRESDVVVAALYIPQNGRYEGLDPTITATKNGVVIKSKKSSELNRYSEGGVIKYEFTLDLTQVADKDILEFTVDALDDFEWAGVVEVRNNQVVIHDDYDPERLEVGVFYGNTTTGDVNDFEWMGPRFNGRLFIIVISDSLGINDGTFTIKDGDSTIFSKKLSECDAKYDYASLGYEYSLNLADVLSIIPDERDLLMSFSYANNTMNEYRIKFDDYIYKGNLAEDIFNQYDIEVSDDKVLNENDTVISIISDANRQSIFIECGGGYFTVYVDDKKVEHLGEISYNNWLTLSDWREDDGDFIDIYHGDEESFIHDVKEYWGDELELFRLTSWHQSSPYVYLTLADLGITESGTYNIRITHYPSVAGGLDDHTNMWEDRNYAAEYFIPTETELINTEITVNLFDDIKLTPEIVIVTGEAIEGSDLVVDVEIDNATGTVNVNDEIVSLVDGKATATIKNLTAGVLDVVVRYDGDDKYSNATKVINVTVMPKQSPDLEVFVENINFGQTANVDIAINAEITGKVTVDGKEVVIENGKAKYNISDLNAGNYSVTVAFDGDKYFNSDEKTVTFQVNKIDSTITVSDVVMSYGDSVNVTVVAEGAVGITSMIGVNEVNPVGFLIPVSGLDVGSYTLTVTTVPDDNHNAVTGTAAVVVNKVDSTLILSESVVSIDYGAVGAVGVNFTGASGVVVDLDGASVDGGVITVSGLDVGNYTLTVTTVPDDNHNAVTETATVIVNKMDSSVSVSDIVFDYGGSGTANVSFTGASGVIASVINNTGAKVDVNGSKIIISGLAAGQYSLKVTTIPNVNYNEASKTVKITVNKLATVLTAVKITKIYGTSKYFVVTLKDSKNKPISNVKVSININGVKTLTTDKNGQIKLSTNALAPKVYTAKISFNGNTNYIKSSTSVKITVKKANLKLTAVNKVFKRTAKTKVYSVALKSNVNKPMKSVKLVLKVGGKTYYAKTNARGIAAFKITKLVKKGNFIASITYTGNAYYNKVLKKVRLSVR